MTELKQFIVTLFDKYGYLLIEAEDMDSALAYLKQVASSSKIYQDLQATKAIHSLDRHLEKNSSSVFEVSNPTLELRAKVQGLLTEESLEKRCIEFAKRHIDDDNEALKGFCNAYNIHRAEGCKEWDISSNFELFQAFINKQIKEKVAPRVDVDGGTEKALRVHTMDMYYNESDGINYNAHIYFWIPKKLVTSWRKNSKGTWSVEIPLWFYDKKLEECIEKKTQYLYEIRK